MLLKKAHSLLFLMPGAGSVGGAVQKWRLFGITTKIKLILPPLPRKRASFMDGPKYNLTAPCCPHIRNPKTVQPSLLVYSSSRNRLTKLKFLIFHTSSNYKVLVHWMPRPCVPKQWDLGQKLRCLWKAWSMAFHALKVVKWALMTPSGHKLTKCKKCQVLTHKKWQK